MDPEPGADAQNSAAPRPRSLTETSGTNASARSKSNEKVRQRHVSVFLGVRQFSASRVILCCGVAIAREWFSAAAPSRYEFPCDADPNGLLTAYARVEPMLVRECEKKIWSGRWFRVVKTVLLRAILPFTVDSS